MLCKDLGSVGKCPSVWEISGTWSIHTFLGLTRGDWCWLLVEAVVGAGVAVEVVEEASQSHCWYLYLSGLGAA